MLIGGAKIVGEGVWLFDVLGDATDELVKVAVKVPEMAENAGEHRKQDDDAMTMHLTDV